MPSTDQALPRRSVEVQFGRYQKNILQESSMAKKLSRVSCCTLKRFPHTFTCVILYRSGYVSRYLFVTTYVKCSTVKLGNKEQFGKEHIGIMEPFPATKNL